MISGAPYAPVGSVRLETIVKLLDIKKGQKIADLGSGDGRIVIASAEKGAVAVGYEIIPPLIILSRRKIKESGVKNATIINKSFWRIDLSQFDAVAIYGTAHTLRRVEKKIKKEMRPGTRVVTNHYRFPTLQIAKTVNDVHLYLL